VVGVTPLILDDVTQDRIRCLVEHHQPFLSPGRSPEQLVELMTTTTVAHGLELWWSMR
jgi:uncharacterized protein (DUF1786 family)